MGCLPQTIRQARASGRIRLHRLLDEAEFARDDRIELGMGGSIPLDADLEGLTETDAVLVLDSRSFADTTPVATRDRLATRIGRIPRHVGVTDIETARLAVTVSSGPIRFRLIPALRVGGEIRMADQSGQRWFSLSPTFFASVLMSEDARLDHRLVPVIKLAKLVVAGLPEDRRVSGYHLEALAIATFRTYSGPPGLAAMLAHFFRAGAKAVLRPLVNAAGESLHLDDELGVADSSHRKQVAASMARTARRMRRAQGPADWAALVARPSS